MVAHLSLSWSNICEDWEGAYLCSATALLETMSIFAMVIFEFPNFEPQLGSSKAAILSAG
jgi:hypothetical protein